MPFSGPLIDECKKYVDRYHMNESVCFLQDRSDVAQLYSAMDCFLLPSKYEGLGIVFIEAQASGLYCFASNRVPTDTRITKNIEYLSLKKNAAFWADEIFHCIVNSKVDRLSAYNEARKNGVDIKKGNEMLLNKLRNFEDYEIGLLLHRFYCTSCKETGGCQWTWIRFPDFVLPYQRAVMSFFTEEIENVRDENGGTETMENPSLRKSTGWRDSRSKWEKIFPIYVAYYDHIRNGSPKDFFLYMGRPMLPVRDY